MAFTVVCVCPLLHILESILSAESARRERMLAKVLPGNDEEDSDDGGMMEQKNAETQSCKNYLIHTHTHSNLLTIIAK